MYSVIFHVYIKNVQIRLITQLLVLYFWVVFKLLMQIIWYSTCLLLFMDRCTAMPTRLIYVSNDSFQLFNGVLVFPTYIKPCEGMVVLRTEFRVLYLEGKCSLKSTIFQIEILFLTHLLIDDHVNCFHSIATYGKIYCREHGGMCTSHSCHGLDSFEHMCRSKTTEPCGKLLCL